MKAVDFEQCGKAAESKMRKIQLMVDPWQLRLDQEAEDKETKRKFEL